MPEFAYRAKTSTGDVSQGVVTAGTHREAVTQLMQRALFPLEVRDRDEGNRWLKFQIGRAHV